MIFLNITFGVTEFYIYITYCEIIKPARNWEISNNFSLVLKWFRNGLVQNEYVKVKNDTFKS